MLLQSHTLVIGLWSLSNPSTVIREALQEPALRLFEVSFATEFTQTLAALLHGLEYMAQKSEEE